MRVLSIMWRGVDPMELTIFMRSPQQKQTSGSTFRTYLVRAAIGLVEGDGAVVGLGGRAVRGEEVGHTRRAAADTDRSPCQGRPFSPHRCASAAGLRFGTLNWLAMSGDPPGGVCVQLPPATA